MNTKQKCLLQLVKEIDAFCREHDITYYCAAGTVLGAIRHNGFIPWDDDIDILMTRSEFLKFSEAFRKYGPADRTVEVYEDNHDHHSPVARYHREGTTMFCHYNITGHSSAGILIDIFILDPVPDDLKTQREYIAKFYAYSDLIAPTLSYSSRLPSEYSHIIDHYRKAAESAGTETAASELAAELFSYDEDSCGSYILRWGSQPFIYPKDFFGIPKYLHFEDLDIPVPSKWPLYLASHYGCRWTDIPFVDMQDHHNTIFDPDKDYHEFYELRDRLFDQGALEDLHERMKSARRRNDSLEHELEEYASDLQIRLCRQEILHNLDAAGLLPDEAAFDPLLSGTRSLFESGQYKMITDIWAPLISLQTARKFSGGQRHGQYYHWLFPVVIPVDASVMHDILWSLIFTGKLKTAEKLTGIYSRAGISSDELTEVKALIDKVNTASGYYYSDDFTGTLSYLNDIPEYERIPALADLYRLASVRLGIQPEQAEALRALADGKDATEGIIKAWGDWLYESGKHTEAGNVYTHLMKTSRNGMFLKDILAKGFSAEIPLSETSGSSPDAAVTECLRALRDEVLDICAAASIRVSHPDAADTAVLPGMPVFTMDADAAAAFLASVEKALPENRRLLSWASGDPVKGPDILYAAADTVFCDLRHPADFSCRHLSVRIHIRPSGSTLSKIYSKLLKVADTDPIDRTGSRSGFRSRLYDHLANMSPERKAGLRMRAFRSVCGSLKAGRSGSASLKYDPMPDSISIFVLQSASVPAGQLIAGEDKAKYKALPWSDYGKARKNVKKFDSKVKDVWEQMLISGGTVL